jgi:acetyl-CoA C-acetyltransferase
MGGLQGVLAPVAAPALGAAAVKAALERAKVPGDAVDESIMGCVLPAGMGQAPARQASLGAGIPVAAGCTTVNKMCGSGMKAVMFAHDAIKAGSAEIVVAGGMESMTNSPYLLPKVRDGMRLGHGEVLDHMFYDGLEDAYEKGRLMGTFAEDCATKYGFSREAQDAYAIESLTRARNAVENGEFAREITAVEVHARRETKVIDVDEQPGKANLERVPELRPAFAKNGTVTAANSSSISDGAAALVVISAEKAAALDLLPRARIVAHASFAQEPGWFTTAPVTAVQMLLDRIGWTVDQVDLFEVNEAFAVVAMAAMHGLEIPHAKLNVRGGACALGHPIGASGARILVTLLHALEDLGLKRGVASLCIGGGEATAVALEIGV